MTYTELGDGEVCCGEEVNPAHARLGVAHIPRVAKVICKPGLEPEGMVKMMENFHRPKLLLEFNVNTWSQIVIYNSKHIFDDTPLMTPELFEWSCRSIVNTHLDCITPL